MAVITLIPGDGIGPEITDAVVHIFDAAGAELTYEEHKAGLTALREMGELIPPDLVESIQRNKSSPERTFNYSSGGRIQKYQCYPSANV